MKMTRCGQRRAALQLSPERRESPRLCHRRNIPGLLPGLGRRMAAPRCFFRLAQAEMFWRILRGRTKLLRRRQGDRQRRSPTTSDYVATSARSAWVVRPDELQSRVEPFCEAEITHQWFAAIIEQNVSRFKIAMENSPAVGVFDSARYLRHQLHTLSRFARTSRLCVVQASARREFHTEKRKAVLAFAYLIYRKDVRMI